MRTTWQPLSNETKRGDSVELSRFFVFGDSKEMREKIHYYEQTPLIVTYHPAALLRNGSFKKPTWKDFQWIESILLGNIEIG